MKNSIALLLLIIFLCGCSNDDNNDNSPTRKYADRVVLEYPEDDDEPVTTHIMYNNDMQVTAFISDDDLALRFEYENGKIVKVTEDGGAIAPYTLHYTGGVLSGVDHYDETYTVAYNSAQNSYTFLEDNLKVGLQDRDILYINGNGGYNQSFTYDTNFKGAFHDVPMDNLFTLTLFSNQHYYYLTSAALKSITLSEDNNAMVYVAENTYDEDGYIQTCVLKSGTQQVYKVTYHYKEL
jgi:hypothetical protein